MKVNVEKSVVLVVDIQERLYPAMGNKEEVLGNSIVLLKGAAVHGIPVITTEQYPKGLGATLTEIKEAAPSMEIFEKTQFSCLEGSITEKLNELKSHGKDTIIVCGMETHVCVLQTIRDLKEKGFNVVVAADCVASRKDIDKQMGLERAKYEGAVMGTYESVLFEWTVTAKNEHFKEISKLVK